jgi:hypothetical protein
MPKHRSALRARDNRRFRVTATVERFSLRNGWNGPERTVLLRDVRDADSGELLTGHLWFKAGKWAGGFAEGDRIAFCARATRYEKGYRGHRFIADAPPPAFDWRLERPTQIVRLP